MASVYDYETGDELTTGLQGCRICDEAIIAAKQLADIRGEPVHLVDDDGEWLVYPADADGSRRACERIESEEDKDPSDIVIGDWTD